jgi:ribosomal protein S18 acetylase RimI-like enzyme
MNHKILLFEELSLNSHPALQAQLYDGWLLRFANGYTNRANSVNPLYPSSLPPEKKLAFCENIYASQGLPPCFKLTEASPSGLDELLSARGYEVVTLTTVMGTRLRYFPTGDCVLTSYADDAWLDSYFAFTRCAGSAKMMTMKQILQNIQSPMLCGRIVKNGVSVACGMCVTERGYAGLLNIVVDAPQRGKGYGREICQSLLAAAGRLGAHTAYLQVVSNNVAAVKLYKKLGFEDAYRYWYRVKKNAV